MTFMKAIKARKSIGRNLGMKWLVVEWKRGSFDSR